MLRAKYAEAKLKIKESNYWVAAAGVSQLDCAKSFSVHQTSVYRLFRIYVITGSTNDRPRPGQPRVSTRRQDNYIRQRHLRDRFTTAVSTANVTRGIHGMKINARTMIRRLREYGIRCRRPTRGQALSRRQRQSRFRWAVNMLRIQLQNWNNVVLRMSPGLPSVLLMAESVSTESRTAFSEDCCVLERDIFGGGSVMVWGTINSNFWSDLVIINGNLTVQR